ncbi:hypothetical protein [Geoalkalibacter halelectricus]|nr:hypothetical protein [Geoalkalibacter halelectricus]
MGAIPRHGRQGLPPGNLPDVGQPLGDLNAPGIYLDFCQWDDIF